MSEHFGSIQFSGKDIPAQIVKFDRLAFDSKRRIMLVSVIAEAQVIKAIRSILNGGARATIQAKGVQVGIPVKGAGTNRLDHDMHKVDEGYECHTQKLRYGQVHAMFIARSPGFMRVIGEESLWQELMSTRYTTPMIREWLPFVTKQLMDQNILKFCPSFNAKCGELVATVEQLDRIVSSGLSTGAIKIPGSKLDPAA